MNEPAEIAAVDTEPADPAFRTAPPNVRKAAAWLEAQGPHRGRRQAMQALALALPLAGFASAAAIASLTGSEPLGLLAILAGFGAMGGATWSIRRRWGRTTAWAEALVQRWQALDEVAAPEAAAPPPEESASDRLVTRIVALAGPRHAVRDAAIHAGDQARRWEAELRRLSDLATGDPRADATLDGARERLGTELAETRTRLAEVYAALVELETNTEEADALDRTVHRLAAELEVEDATRRARTAHRAAQRE